MRSTRRPKLTLRWITLDAALYACRMWHYSGTLQNVDGTVKIGVWEGDAFKGAVIFSRGSGKWMRHGEKGGLKEYGQVVQLSRVALADHAWPVTRIISVTIRMLRKQCPGLRLIISYADFAQGHLGRTQPGWTFSTGC